MRLDLGNITGNEVLQVFAAIPDDVTSLDLSMNDLGFKTGTELRQVFTAIPANVTSLDLSKNRLGCKTGVELAQALAAIPDSVISLDLRDNDLNFITDAELAQALAAIPDSVTSLDLSMNFLRFKTADELVQVFADIPPRKTSLNLIIKDLGKKTRDELVQILAVMPVGMTLNNLSSNDFDNNTAAELTQALDKIPDEQINSVDSTIQKKYDINLILDNYLAGRRAVTNSSGATKEYFHGSFFSIFQKSFTQKRDAVANLKLALDGVDVDLSKHLSTLRNGKLGKELRSFIQSGMGDDLVGKEVNTVSDFVQALQDKNRVVQDNCCR
ncbi:hypothetical protein [Legionella sp.]|uniref:hypothetical protein n=1 Tax=Legionella sp. TaxID=459 RepID=UPI003C887052